MWLKLRTIIFMSEYNLDFNVFGFIEFFRSSVFTLSEQSITLAQGFPQEVQEPKTSIDNTTDVINSQHTLTVLIYVTLPPRTCSNTRTVTSSDNMASESSESMSQDALFAAVSASMATIDDVIMTCCSVKVTSAQKGSADDIVMTTEEPDEPGESGQSHFLRKGLRTLVHIQ